MKQGLTCATSPEIVGVIRASEEQQVSKKGRRLRRPFLLHLYQEMSYAAGARIDSSAAVMSAARTPCVSPSSFAPPLVR